MNKGFRHANEDTQSVQSLGDHFQKGKRTGCIYHLAAQSLNYDDSYFLKEYQDQYGRTYFKDERSLRDNFKKHLAIIKKFKKAPASLLELGSAAGFFLDEARSAGYNVSGCEISKFATEYAQNTYGLDIFNGSFLDMPLKKYDIVVACYTIEHFANQPLVFQKIYDCLNSHGLLFFALPSYYGPVMQYQRPKWIQTHPLDHFVDYSPKSIKTTLALYQLDLKYIQPASYHQKRAGGWKKMLPPGLYKKYADLVCYADTMNGCAIRQEFHQ